MKALTDMRGAIEECYRWGVRIDGVRHLGQSSAAAGLVNRVWAAARRNGMSEEDLMLALAYYALEAYEQTTDRLLEAASHAPPPVRFLAKDATNFPLISPADQADPSAACNSPMKNEK